MNSELPPYIDAIVDGGATGDGGSGRGHRLPFSLVFDDDRKKLFERFETEGGIGFVKHVELEIEFAQLLVDRIITRISDENDEELIRIKNELLQCIDGMRAIITEVNQKKLKSSPLALGVLMAYYSVGNTVAEVSSDDDLLDYITFARDFIQRKNVIGDEKMTLLRAINGVEFDMVQERYAEFREKVDLLGTRYLEIHSITD